MTENWIHDHVGHESRWGAHGEPQSNILNKPLIINIAPAGTHVSRNTNPNQPYFPEEILKEVKECYEMGASMWHIHVRDRKTAKPSVDPVLMAETILAVKEACKGIMCSAHLDHDLHLTDRGIFVKTIEGLAKLNALPDTVIIHVASRTSRVVNEKGLIDQVKYVQEVGLIPELNLQTFVGIDNVKRWLIANNAVKAPVFIAHNLGKHETVPLNFDDPMWNYILTLTMLKTLPPGTPNTIVGLHAGGRWWLPTTILGIINGVDEVRFGMEDAIYKYPHSEETVPNNRNLMETVTTIAKQLGRTIATPQQTRQLFGLGEVK